MYEIRPYSYRRADEIGVQIVPSIRLNKKIDIYTIKGEYIGSVGDNRYGDYPTYLQTEGEVFANNRRRLYKIRHQKDRKVPYSMGWYADQLLW
jgi:sporulation protein YlmC with PRC-barrel domain